MYKPCALKESLKETVTAAGPWRKILRIDRAGLPVRAPASLDAERFLELMAVDKKAQAGRLRLVLLRAIGEAELRSDTDPGVLRALLDQFPRGP